ncbi:MAG TPA: hypothetical protein VGM63_13615 [Mucilaginibacter sp.]
MPYLVRSGSFFANIAMPFLTHRPYLFYLISPEAALLTLRQYLWFKQKGRWPDRKAGRAYGVNDGLAFAMCGARKKRKNRQGGLKLFYVLIFGYFPSKGK